MSPTNHTSLKNNLLLVITVHYLKIHHFHLKGTLEKYNHKYCTNEFQEICVDITEDEIQDDLMRLMNKPILKVLVDHIHLYEHGTK